MPSSNPVSLRLPTRQVTCWLLVCFVAGAAACSPSDPPPADDLHLRIGFGLDESGDRQNAMGVLGSHLSTESLLSIESTGRPQPGLAESWHWSDDGLTLVVQLREGVRFHDGSPLTAASVVSALERTGPRQRPASAFRHITSIAAQGDNQVAIHLARPDAFLLSDLAQVTVSGPDGGGTGPFRIISEEPLRLERFEGYHRGPSKIRSITIQPFDSQRSAWAALLRGELEAVQEIQPDSVEFMQGSTQVTTSSLVRPFYIMLALNQRHAVLRHTDVRRAIAEAVDRDEIVRDALRGMGRVADNPIWPDHWALSSAARRHVHNPEAARLRLDNAGFPQRRAGQNGMARRFSVTCVFWEEEPYERIALLLQRQLMRVGIDVQLKGLPLNELAPRAGSGDFEIALLPARGGRSLDVTYDFWRSPVAGASPHVNLGYTGVDAIFDRLRTARTDAEIRTAVGDLQERFYEDAPAVFLAWQQTTRAVSSNIDVSDSRDSDIFSNIWRWRPAGAGQSP